MKGNIESVREVQPCENVISGNGLMNGCLA
jgi:hypothetical protein